MKKALFFALILSFLFIFILFPCLGCKKHKPPVTNFYVIESVSESVNSDIEQGTPDDSVIDESGSSDSNDEQNSNKELSSNDEQNEDVIGEATIIESNSDNAIVIVEGSGKTFAEAKKVALRSAVEEVVGSLVDAQFRVENDELIEHILAASSAYVEKSEVLSAENKNGRSIIKLNVTVEKLFLRKKLNLSPFSQIIPFDGMNVYNLISSKLDSEKNGALSLAEFLKNEEFPYSLLDTEVIGDSTIITHRENEVVLTFTVKASINRERYSDFIKRIKPIFDKYAYQQSSFEIKGNEIKTDKRASRTSADNNQNKITFSESNISGKDISYKDAYIPVFLCTGISSKSGLLKFDEYALPQKFAAPLLYYKRLAPAVEVMILDEDNNVIASKNFRLCLDEKTDSYRPLNAMPSIFNDEIEYVKPHVSSYYLRSVNIDEEPVDESTILNWKYSREYRADAFYMNPNWLKKVQWCVFAPCITRRESSSSFSVLYSHDFKVTIVLPSEELSKMRSVKASANVNNSKMDKAFESMKKDMEKIETEFQIEAEFTGVNKSR